MSRFLFSSLCLALAVALSSCGYPYCVLGFGNCAAYGNGTTGGAAGGTSGVCGPTSATGGGNLALTISTPTIMYSGSESLSISYGTPPYTLMSCFTPPCTLSNSSSNQSTNGMLSPAYLPSGNSASYTPPNTGLPQGASQQQDQSTNRPYYCMGIIAKDNANNTAAVAFQVFLQ